MTRTLKLVLGAVVAVGLLVLPRFVFPVLALDLLCFGLFALAFDIVFGHGGLLSFGHAAFWGLSGYVTAITLLHTALPVPVAILLGVAGATALALPVGWLSIRSVGIYFSMITLAFGQMVHFVALQWGSVTGGDNGLPGFPRPPFLGIDFSNSVHTYYFGLALVAAGGWVAWRAMRSPFGTALRATRDNERRAQSVGYDTTAQKFAAFVLSGALSGLAGGVFVVNHAVVHPDQVNWTTSGEVVLTTLLGGSGTFLGPWVGAAVVLLVRDALSTSTAATGVVTGLVFVVSVLFFRKGLVGAVNARLERRAPETPVVAGTAANPPPAR